MIERTNKDWFVEKVNPKRKRFYGYNTALFACLPQLLNLWSRSKKVEGGFAFFMHLRPHIRILYIYFTTLHKSHLTGRLWCDIVTGAGMMTLLKPVNTYGRETNQLKESNLTNWLNHNWCQPVKLSNNANYNGSGEL